jgi:hypothetical protein
LCAGCGTRRLLLDSVITSVFGWWGVLSFFRTPKALVTNVSAAHSFRDSLGSRSIGLRVLPAALLFLTIAALLVGVAAAVLFLAAMDSVSS